ncbi:Uncharacterised protein at_DN0666 [Pycnogonum litorale]
MKDCLWALTDAWNSVEMSTLKIAWHNIWPISMFDDDFDGFQISSEKAHAAELLRYTTGLQIHDAEIAELQENDFNDWLDCDRDAPITNQMTDDEILSVVTSQNQAGTVTDSESDDELPDTEPKVTIKRGYSWALSI